MSVHVFEENQQTLNEIGIKLALGEPFLASDLTALENIADQRNAGLAPNPAQGAALLDLGRLVVSGRAVLRDLNGRAVQEWQLDGQRQLWLRWDQHLPAGIYLLELLADQAVPQVLKLAIEHH